MVELNVAQYCCAGLNFGCFYDDSPLIADDGEPHPPYTMATFTPSTVPGCRLPHVWLADGRSLYDASGRRLHAAAPGGPTDTAGLEAAARRQRMPLAVLDLSDEDPPIPGARHRLIVVQARPARRLAG